jgi:polyphosphate kinase 2 (PPK2 family)
MLYADKRYALLVVLQGVDAGGKDVLVARVHKLVPKSVWLKRYDEINDFEKEQDANRVRILKFYLQISKEEQLRRLLYRSLRGASPAQRVVSICERTHLSYASVLKCIDIGQSYVLLSIANLR